MPKVGFAKNQKLSPEMLLRQIEKMPYLLDKAALNFSVEVARKARKTFRNSFKYHRFYSAEGKSWEPLTEYTKAKRLKNKTLKKGILREFNTLVDSIQLDTKIAPPAPHVARERIFTNPSSFNASTNPHRGFCYAGVHNNPGPGDTYGNGFGGKRRVIRAKQRQFMGFSTYIDKFAEDNMNKLLLDGVFGDAESLEMMFANR